MISFKKYKTGYGKANGTFGELLQGMLPCQKSFMVTFPINLFSYATFIPNTSSTEITVYPKHKAKSLALAHNLLKLLNINIGGTLIIESELVEGKGLASSSADLVATAYAVTNSIGANITEDLIAQLIYPIEPSDGVMYPGIISFDYKELKLINNIGILPKLTIIAIDEGNQIDTIEYNSIKRICSKYYSMKYEKLLIQMSNAIKNQDLQMVGKISTESAIMNQANNPKKFLQELIDICKTIGALGVSTTHSGTFIGIIMNPEALDFSYQKTLCIEKLKHLSRNVSVFHTINFNKPKYSHINQKSYA
jgi:uncharacterized protein involved in propanediol utilization